MPADLSLSRHDDGGLSVIAVSGEIDEWTSTALLLGVRQALLESAAVSLDLVDVTFIGSAGLSALLQLHAHADRHRRPLRIMRASSTVCRAIELARLEEVLPVDAGPP